MNEDLNVAKETPEVVNNFLNIKKAEEANFTHRVVVLAGAAVSIISATGLAYAVTHGVDLSNLGMFGDIIKAVFSAIGVASSV